MVSFVKEVGVTSEQKTKIFFSFVLVLWDFHNTQGRDTDVKNYLFNRDRYCYLKEGLIEKKGH